jgi:hypothetical protein
MRKLLLALLATLPVACCAPEHSENLLQEAPPAAQDAPPPQVVTPYASWYPAVIEEGVSRLAARVPLDKPFSVGVTMLPGMWGAARYCGDCDAYEILLSPWVRQEDFLLDILTHEWAHCLVWGAALDDDPHGPLWGVAYSRAYLAMLAGPVEAPGSPQDEPAPPEVPEGPPPPAAAPPDERGCVACH